MAMRNTTLVFDEPALLVDDEYVTSFGGLFDDVALRVVLKEEAYERVIRRRYNFWRGTASLEDLVFVLIIMFDLRYRQDSLFYNRQCMHVENYTSSLHVLFHYDHITSRDHPCCLLGYLCQHIIVMWHLGTILDGTFFI
ncbi:hypothetical protein ACJX0J_034088 [Zea mays]